MKTFYKALIVFSCALLILNDGFAQAPNWEWADRIGALSYDSGSSIAIDALGNVYTTGYFMYTVDFDPGPGTFNLTALDGHREIFVSKLDKSGNFIWAKRMGGTEHDNGNSIAVDISGNVYITGYFTGTADFDPDSSVNFYLTSTGTISQDIFISKLDSAGNFVWAKQMGGTVHDYGYSIVVDASENVFTIGSFEGSADFDPDSSVNFYLTSSGTNDIFISKLDSSGNFVWAKAIGGTGGYNDGNSTIALNNSGNVYITGYFAGTADFDPDSTLNFNLTSVGIHDIFVCKLDPSGNFVWAKAMGGVGNEKGNSITLDALDNVYATGYFEGTADFDPDTLVNFDLTSAGLSDIFVFKLDSVGNFLWAKQIGGTGNDGGQYIHLGAIDSIYMAGYFTGTVDFDPGAGTFNLNSVAFKDIFILKSDNSGNFVWAKAFGGNRDEFSNSIALDSSENVYIAGGFDSYFINFGCTTLANANTNGGPDIFIAKLSFPTFTTVNPIVCNSYISPSGNYIWTNSGTYMDTVSNTLGCDSVIIINLIINTVNSSVMQSGITLTANATGAMYQWLDCNNGLIPLIGDTNQVFMATINGNYALVIIQNGCTDTSACYAIAGVGITKNNFENNFEVFPNPSSVHFFIVLKNYLKKVNVTISDITGEIIYSITAIATQTIEVSTKDFSEGIYLVQIQTADFIETRKIVVVK